MTEKQPLKPLTPRLGELVVKDGLAKKDDVVKALQVQREETEELNLPVDVYMIRKGLVSDKQLETLKNHPKADQMDLAQLAYHFNIISKDQLDDVLNRHLRQRSLGEILCDSGVISTQDLSQILHKYSKQLKFGEILLRNELIDETKLNNALREQVHKSDPLGKILVAKKIITTDQLYQALSKQYNIPYKKLDGFVIYDREVDRLTNIIGHKYAEKNEILPISLHGNDLTLAVYDHMRIPIIQELGYVYSHLRLKCVFVTQDKFSELFETLYSKELTKRLADEDRQPTIAGMLDIDLDEDAGDDKGERVGSAYGSAPIEAEKIVNFLIKYGIMNGASDIHVEQSRKRPKIRYRIDGVLNTLKVPWLDERIGDMIGAVVSRIKVISNLDIAERRLPQDGVFRVQYFDRAKRQSFDLDFRVATCPAIIGENVTMRILDSRKADVGLEHLNHSAHVLGPFKQMLKSSAGMVLVSGPTGSGKTSTLYGALRHIYNPGIKIITAEDPIEYSFSDIMQTQINPKIGLTFSRLLRSFLRFDPDVMLVGEMRDIETASIGFDAALTGHLLLSTIHTNDSVAAISRLEDLNVERNQLASCLLGVLAQRLVRKICPKCRRECIPDEMEWSVLFEKRPDHLTFYKGDGCSECAFSGYKGRTVISELLALDPEIGAALNARVGEADIRRMVIDKGMKTMLDDGILKLNETTLQEIIRVVPHEMLKEFKNRY